MARNEAEWLELFEHPIFSDADDVRHKPAWHWAQELERGGRMTKADIYALAGLINAATKENFG